MFIATVTILWWWEIHLYRIT